MLIITLLQTSQITLLYTNMTLESSSFLEKIYRKESPLTTPIKRATNEPYSESPMRLRPTGCKKETFGAIYGFFQQLANQLDESSEKYTHLHSNDVLE
ncbi:hypothetical protein NPIL_425381 [Nephila pilipes]|uniref:Uncharacterized protein n=1 Tax=Nephila pilipes TaxID=299642 RepID=A0A8X6N8R9_NEPPI|nr:hypothetical protein NPIL_392461 [Nephila pilipes]GFU22194.1 hypothetical protein NPIL_425381 [Nephila pilipes]